MAQVKSKTKSTKKKVKKKVTNGIVVINSTFNNTIVTITDTVGNVLSWASAGTVGFSGAKKSTPFAAQLAADAAAKKAVETYDLQRVEVRVSGPGAGRETAMRAIQQAGLGIMLMGDRTPLPHNGCRAKKPRRV